MTFERRSASTRDNEGTGFFEHIFVLSEDLSVSKLCAFHTRVAENTSKKKCEESRGRSASRRRDALHPLRSRSGGVARQAPKLMLLRARSSKRKQTTQAPRIPRCRLNCNLNLVRTSRPTTTPRAAVSSAAIFSLAVKTPSTTHILVRFDAAKLRMGAPPTLLGALKECMIYSFVRGSLPQYDVLTGSLIYYAKQIGTVTVINSTCVCAYNLLYLNLVH